jgi:hypothetical protein
VSPRAAPAAAVRPAVAGDLAALQALARRTLRACYPPVLGAAAVAAYVDGGAADAYLAERLPAGATWCLEAAPDNHWNRKPE